MPSNPDRPFDHDTLKLRAVFIPEAAKDKVSQATITSALGHGALKIPAVFVPEGATPPGYPYERFGRAQFRPDDDVVAKRAFTSWPTSSQPAAQAQDDAPGPSLPRTRYRFGSALPNRSPGPPPNPTLASRETNTVLAAIGVLRGIAKATRSLANREATGTARPAIASPSVPIASPNALHREDQDRGHRENPDPTQTEAPDRTHQEE